MEEGVWIQPGAPLALLGAGTAWSRAQGSPLAAGMTSIPDTLIEWLIPSAILLVAFLGGMALARRISWAWCIGAVVGIAITFGVPQVVTWIRDLWAV